MRNVDRQKMFVKLEIDKKKHVNFEVGNET